VIENLPYRVYQEDFVVEGFPAEEIALSDIGNGYYLTNRLSVCLVQSDSFADIDAITEAVASVQGEIERFTPYNITIYVPPSDDEGLWALGDYLTDNFPHLFQSASIVILYITGGQLSSSGEGGGFFSSDVTVGSSFRTNNTNRWGTSRDWAHRAADFTRAWAVFGAQERD
jgi:hypothetical protein